jgi:hypothetical protein
MNLGASHIVLRSRSVTELLDLGCLVVTTGFRRTLLGLVAVALLPGYVGALVLRYALGAPWVWVWLAAWAWASIAQGVFTVAVGRWMFADDLTVREVLKGFFGRFPSFLGAWLLRAFYLAVGLPTVGLLTLLGLYHTLSLNETSLLERVGAGSALRRGVQFVGALGGRAFGMTVMLVVAQGYGIAAFELLGQFTVESVLQLGEPFPSLFREGGSPYALLGLFAVAPYVAISRFLFYIDGRTRNDGWDIQVRFMAVANREAAGGAR